MDKFKKELFEKDYSTQIQYDNLNEADTSNLNAFLSSTFELDINSSDFFKKLQSKLINSKRVDDLNSAIGIKKALQELNLFRQEKVIIIWTYPSDLDKFNLKYLVKFWESIWYGASDDAICLFFRQTNKIILITHYDTIYY